jgi:hypothetical protein
VSSLLRCVSFDRGIWFVSSGESPDFCDIRIVSTIIFSAYCINPVSSRSRKQYTSDLRVSTCR